MEVKKLMHNSVLCTQCGETLVSYHTHDYKKCSCENETMVDGGTDYQRFGGKDLSKVQSFCLYDDSPHELLREYVCRGGRGKNGNEPLKYIRLKDIDDKWLDAIIRYEEEFRPSNKFLNLYKSEQEYRKTL